jgi:murein tripeptide amidase MpaA
LILTFHFVMSLCAGEDWTTYYEQSGYLRTPRYDQTMEYCRKLDQASPMVALSSVGKSGQGRDIPLLVIDRDGLTDPAAIHRTGRVVLLLQACIHPGECEGKDAGLMLARDLVIIKKYPGILDHVSILFIPIFNVDGHERFGPYNRINQNGPEEMGWRVTASNLNLNRDFLKADTPEMQAWLKMFSVWMPDFFIDSHTTDGADYQYPLTYEVELFGNMDPGLTKWAKEMFTPGLEGSMAQAGYPVFPYVDFRNWHDPRSGLVSEVAPPMLSQGYTSLMNRPGLLIETHMLKPYRVRVSSTYECVLSTLNILSGQGKELRSLISRADAFVSGPEFLSEPFPLKFRIDESDSVIADFKGIEYSTEKSMISGETWFLYGDTPVTMKIPWFHRNVPSVTVNLPSAYVIPPEWETVIGRLEVHGVSMKRLKSPMKVKISTYRFRNPKWQSNPYEGRHPLIQFSCEEITEDREFPAGSVIVEVSQPAARIIAQMLEPRGEGSLVYWGFFDAIFEQKEYAENYVLEKMAARMLAEDPSIRTEFEQKKAADTAFAKSPDQILNWFYSKSPYIDQRRNIYPIARIMDRHALTELEKSCLP